MSIPDTIGRFRIDREIGRGTTGIVYLAWDPSLDRRIAIKLLAPVLESVLESDREDRKLASFERELRAAGGFSHPNIVAVHDVGHHEDRPFIAMEYIEGKTLGEIIRSGRDLSPAKIVDIARQIGGALDHAHERSIVHRDVKLSNILLGVDGVAKITDFGVAKLPSSNETLAGTAMGTPSYMAPETLVGAKVSGASDQFSLAVVLFELLTGERPFSSATLQAVMYKIVNEKPTSPGALSPELPDAVEPVLLRALEKDPGNRYPSCAELADALGSALGVEGEAGLRPVVAAEIRAGSAVPPSSRGPQRKTAVRGALPRKLRRRVVRIAAGVALVVAVALLAWLSVRRPDAPSGERIEFEPSVRPGRPLPLSGPDDPPDVIGDRFLGVEPPDISPEDEAWETWERPGIRTARTMRIVTEPPGARIFRNSELLEGVTPLEMLLEPATDYRFRVERDGYLPAGVAVSLESLSPDQLAGGVLFFPLRADPTASGPGATAAPGISEAGATGDRAVADRGPARLSIRLVSEVRRGVLTVYRGQKQLISESFRFEDTVGPASAGREPGTLEFRRELDPGPAELRAYVTLRGAPARMASVTVDLEAGSSPVLIVHVVEQGPPRLEIR